MQIALSVIRVRVADVTSMFDGTKVQFTCHLGSYLYLTPVQKVRSASARKTIPR